MNRREILTALSAAAIPLVLGTPAQAQAPGTHQPAADPGETVFELRVYHTFDGKLDALLSRFREHTIGIFNRHQMTSIAYWTPLDEPLQGRTLFYILKHPSREAARANWDAFSHDPEWVKVQAASEANGKLVEKVDSTFLKLTDFSPPL